MTSLSKSHCGDPKRGLACVTEGHTLSRQMGPKQENATILHLVGPPFPSRQEDEVDTYIRLYPAGPMSAAGLRSGEVIGPQPSEPKGNLLELLQ